MGSVPTPYWCRQPEWLSWGMRLAFAEAQLALSKQEIPVGAAVVCGYTVLGKGHNLTETLNDCTAHAEMLALTAAMNTLGAKYLTGCSLFVTLEPCLMCAGALHWAKLESVIIGASDERNGYSQYTQRPFHPKTHVVTGIEAESCARLLTDFFKAKRPQ